MTFVETLKELVAIPSITGNEEAIATHMASKLDGYGHAVVRQGNSIAAHIPGQRRDTAFILNGHLDTVPVVEGWKTDPFKLTPDSDDADWVKGLGTTDMKNGVAIIDEKAAEYAVNKPPCDTWIFLTSSEEVDNEGVKQLTAWFAAEHQQRYRSLGGLILEPTVVDGNAPFVGVGHRNGLMLEVSAEGIDGHGSQLLADGVTAIERLSRFITLGLPAVRERWAKAYGHELLGAPTLNPTNLHAGVGKHNIIPQMGKLVLDMRTTPALNDALTGEIVRLQEEYGLTVTSPWKATNTLCPPDARIYTAMQKAMPDAAFRAFPGATDLFAFLEHNIPMLIYGAGTIGEMHEANEGVSLAAMYHGYRAVGDIHNAFAAS